MSSRGQRRPLLRAGLAPAELDFFTELRRLVDLVSLTCRTLEKSTSSVKSASGDACFYSKSQWARWLNAEGTPPRKAIRRLAEALAREDIDASHLTQMWEKAFVPYPRRGRSAGQVLEPGLSGMDAARIDTSRPHIARVYDYLLGGKDNFAADRMAADEIIASVPEVRDGVRAQRALLGRVVRFLVGEAGIRQLSMRNIPQNWWEPWAVAFRPAVTCSSIT